MPQRLPLPCDCPHCHTHRSVEQPSGAWKAALVLGYVILAAMGLGMGVMGIAGPFVVLPVAALYALGTLPWLHTHASAPATCNACGKIVEPQAKPAAPRARRPLTLVAGRATSLRA